MTKRQHSPTPTSAQDGEPPTTHRGTHRGTDRRSALLTPHGGAGAELRGHVPPDPVGVVLILHGGAEVGRMPVAWKWPTARPRSSTPSCTYLKMSCMTIVSCSMPTISVMLVTRRMPPWRRLA